MNVKEVGPFVRVFGGMGVDAGGEPISIGGSKQQRLLALLVHRTGSVVSIDWLAEHLWGDGDRPGAAAPAIRRYVSRLRQRLPDGAQDWIETERSGYRFAAPTEQIEHLRFAQLCGRARRARDGEDPQTANTLLDEALGLWRGDPFRELEDFDWARPEIEQLRLDRLDALEERWEVVLAQGRHTQIIGELADFTADYGLRERAVRQYALALHRSGRTTEALRVVAAYRRRLADESGQAPSADTLALEQALFAGDQSLDVDTLGRPLRGYRLIEQIGVGALAVVWRGVQPSVDREVAVKRIRPELASQPSFIRRFEAEAHLVARIEHPHIVPLIDFWRDPHSAYLVTQWLRGGTLEHRLDDAPLSVEQTRLLARQMCGALDAAHVRGIVHRYVKPGNILFDEIGNAYLANFGVALEARASVTPDSVISSGSPAYSAPEQLRHEMLGPQTDVFSLGVVLFECLSGSLPFHGSTSLPELIHRQLNDAYPSLTEIRDDVPAAMADAIATATSKDPAERFRSTIDFLEALEGGDQAARDDCPVASQAAVGIENPYKGLRAFDDADADFFFGRECLVAELLDRLSETTVRSRCVVVVGPSGSGKSSLVRAGLVPEVRAGAVSGSENWFATTMTPGANPFESLEAALLRVAVDPPENLQHHLRQGTGGIAHTVRRCVATDEQMVFLIIDQLEEIFTVGADDVAFEFLDALAAAVEDPTSPLRLVVTLRADFFDRPLAHPAFSRILDAVALNVAPLTPHELERAMVEPARRVGVDFERGLVSRIAAEALGQSSPLPLLQYTLSELFDRRDGPLLTIASYDEIGGLTGALAGRAEEIQYAADEAQRSAIRRLFGRLTDPGASAVDLRRRLPLSDLADDPATAWALDAFGSARLVTFDRDVTTREPTVEVAHEALLREWPRLVRWLGEDRDLLRTTKQIVTAANTWDAGGRDRSDLYSAGRLGSAVGLARTAPDRLRSVDTEFIDASRAAAAAVRKSEQHRVHRLRRLVAGVVAALVLALIAGGVALVQRNEAQGATARAELASLITQSAAVAADDDELSILLALEAHRRSPGRESELAVLQALVSSRSDALVEQTIDLELPSIAEFGDGSVVVTGVARHGVQSIDLATEQRVSIPLVTPDGSDFRAVVTRPVDSGFLAISTTGEVARWEDGVMVERVDPAGDALSAFQGWAGYDERMFVAVDRREGNREDQTVYYLNATPGELEVVQAIDGTGVTSGEVDRDGGGFDLLFADGTMRSYDAAGDLAGEADTGLQLNVAEGTASTSSADSRLVAFGGNAGVVIVDRSTDEVTRLPAFQGVQSLSFARSDTLLVIGGADGILRLWDVEHDVSRGVLWRGTEAIDFGTSYDEDTDSLWIAEATMLIKLGLDPEVVLGRACAAVSRDLTQEEWDRFVPGGGDVIPTCTDADAPITG